MYTDFDKRMKKFEKCHTNIQLTPRCPVIIRLDGKAFHTYTKNKLFKSKTKDPFSDLLHYAFVYASIELSKVVEGCRAVYTQSDEVSIWISDSGKSDKSMGWFDFKLQKLVSVSSSIFTAHFNQCIQENISPVDFVPLAIFDARAFTLPNETELNNYFIWRQKDATRNSISMVAHHNFSTKSLHKLNTNKMQDKLFTENGVNWNDFEVWKKRGSLIVKNSKKSDVEYINKRTKKLEIAKDVIRSNWEEIECPEFTQQPIKDIVK